MWSEVQRQLRVALAERRRAELVDTRGAPAPVVESSKPQRSSSKIGRSTLVAVKALAAYWTTHPAAKPTKHRALAARIADFATKQGMEGADNLDVDGVFGAVVEAWLEGCRMARNMPKRDPKNLRKPPETS
jgi:hypothetical protein